MLRSMLIVCALAGAARADLPTAIDAVSADGKHAVACNTELALYSLPDGKATKWKWTKEDVDVACDRGSLSPDGSLLAIRVSPSSEVRVLQLATKKTLATFKFYNPPGPTRFSADGKLLAVESGDSFITLYEVATRKQLGKVQATMVPFELSPKGDALVVGAYAELQLADKTGAIKTRGTVPEPGKPGTPHTWAPAVLAISPDGTKLAVGHMTGIYLFSFPALQLVGSVESKLASRDGLLWSPDGKLLLAAGLYDAKSTAYDGVRLYDVAAAKQVAAMHGQLVGACGSGAALVLTDRASKMQCVKLDAASLHDAT